MVSMGEARGRALNSCKPDDFENFGSHTKEVFRLGFYNGFDAGMEYQAQQAAAQARALEALRVAVGPMIEQADNLYKAAYAIAAQVAEEEALGAEYDKDGWMEVHLSKGAIKAFFAAVFRNRPEIEALRAALRQAEEGGA